MTAFRRTSQAAAVARLGRRLGLGSDRPVLLKSAHHASFRLGRSGLVARVLAAGPTTWAERRARRELRVVRALGRRGAPVAGVCPPLLAGPHRIVGGVVTLRPFHPHDRVAGEGDEAVVVHTLRAAHRALTAAAPALPPFDDHWARARAVLDGPAVLPGLSAADRALLRREGDRLVAWIGGGGLRAVPLHGDAHPGNLLLGGAGPAWIDWEEACLGPVEWDVATLPRAAWPGFPGLDGGLLDACAHLRSACVALWCHAARDPDAATGEAAVHHLDQVRASAGSRRSDAAHHRDPERGGDILA